MRPLNPRKLTIGEAAPLVRARQLSPVALTTGCLARIEQLDTRLNAFVTVLAERAMHDARIAEQEIARGHYRGPLHGIPVAIKDMFDMVGTPTTAASRLYHDRVPDRDATVVQLLRRAGAILIGKSNLHEFGYGATSESSFFGPVRNPWDVRRVAGGSSGGSAAAVAAGCSFAALGTDTGGSVRLPAALCGVVGLKPTYGRVSCHGAIPLAWSLDHPGILARSVGDAALVLQAISGYDAQDPASWDASVPDYLRDIERGATSIRVGYDPHYMARYAGQDVIALFDRALDVLSGAGAELVEVTVQGWDAAHEAAYTITSAEALAYHERTLTERAGDYQPDVRARLEEGFSLRGVNYARAQRVRQVATRLLESLFAQIDILATPTCGYQAPRFGQASKVQELTRFTRLFNLTGSPALTVPCGFTGDQMPAGLQLVAPRGGEGAMLQVAHTFEAATEWQGRTL